MYCVHEGGSKKTARQVERVGRMKIIWYSFYPADYARDTAHLSILEHGAYRLLLDHYYLTGVPLPASAVHLHRVCRTFAEEEQVALHSVLHQFFTLTDDGWRHERVEAELAKSGDISKKRKQAAELRHKKAKFEPVENHANACANADANAMQMDAQLHSHTQEQIQKEEKEKEKKEKPQAAERASRSSVSKPDDVDSQVWSDWLAHRKAKKAPVTQTALDGIAREATKANITMQTALQTMCERGWAGFKAEWLQNVAGKAATASARRSENFDGFLGEPDDRNVIDSTAKWVQ
jgi:uncharacterized protein YdaU (DUF1376 family)